MCDDQLTVRTARKVKTWMSIEFSELDENKTTTEISLKITQLAVTRKVIESLSSQSANRNKFNDFFTCVTFYILFITR